MGGRARGWLWGPAAAVVLAAAAAVSVALGLVPGIPLFDGLSPPAPYRWVNPPPVLRRENRAPDSVTTILALSPAGSAAQDVTTPDLQVDVYLPDGAFAPQAGQTSVTIAIRPVDPATVPAPPPRVVIQGNVYRIDAVYEPSGVTATASQPVTVTLGYPVDATKLILDTGGGWQLLPTIVKSASLQVAATTTGFGLFAAAETGVVPTRPSRVPPWAYGVAGLALVAAAVPTIVHRRRAPPAGEAPG